MNRLITFFLFVLSLTAKADGLVGFLYGDKNAPDGTEWQNPEVLSLNKEQPRAYIFPFAGKEEARQVLPQGSTFYQTLDGTWKFHWVPSPEKRPTTFYQPDFNVSAWDDIAVPGCWNVQGLQKDGTMKYGVPIYVNQPVIFYHEVKVDDWREGVMRQPKDPRWTTYQYPNEVGSYRRSFTVPASWKGRVIYLNFDGVDSFFYLWVNGHYVGFSKNSRNTARFDITPYLNPTGENVLAVEVYRSSDGSFLEAQDMFRLPGIYRSTYLTAFPKVQISDLVVRTAKLSPDDATLNIDYRLSNLTDKVQKDMKITYSIYPVRLYSDETEDCVSEFTVDGLPLMSAVKDTAYHSEAITSFQSPRPWSAEKPNRYVLVAELKDRKGRLIDCTSTYFGIRTVEIRDTEAKDDEFGLAGRYFYVNGKPVKLKGVNRHETNPATGHAITHEQMLQEVMLMKRGNINHVRLSHYSNDPFWYYLTDKYGLYLEDEANIESHEYYYGKESLSHPREWRAAHVARNMEMVHSHVNHPSIVIWSLGNEAGPGENFVAAYDAIKAFDTSRPVQYERNNDIVDMGSNQYPGVAWVQQVAKGKANVKYPYHISEYAHSMGNSLGNLVDYWEAMESTNYFCGAAIWDWVDQAIDTYTKNGVKYMGYGGDHGDWPNDGMFCMNGIMLPDLTPKPQYYEVKKVYQNVGVTLNKTQKATDRTIADFVIFNKNYFEPIAFDTYDIVACLIRDGRKVSELPLHLSESIMPRRQAHILCPVDMSQPGEYFLNVEFRLRQDMPWAKQGYVQMEEQLSLGNTAKPLARPALAASAAAPVMKSFGEKTTVSGSGFTVSFDDADGSLHSLCYDDTYVIQPGDGPKLDAFRAPVDNDNWAWNPWFQNGLYALQHRADGLPLLMNNPDGSVSIVYTVVSQAKARGEAQKRPGKAGQPFQSVSAGQEMTADDFHFTTTQRYTVFPDGSIHVAASIVSSDPTVVLPRLGYAMKLPKAFDSYTYYGRGPLNNYADRKTGSFLGLYQSTVQQQFVNFPKPQSMGNRENVRWCSLQDGEGRGALFVSNIQGGMSVSALPWSAVQLTFAAHPHELPKSDGTYLHLDCQVTGLGGNSCGQGGPLQPDRVTGPIHQMKYMIRPIRKGDSLTEQANIWCPIPSPVSISRNRSGLVSIQGDPSLPLPVCYQITEPGAKKPGKAVTVEADRLSDLSIPMRNGGTITAWYQDDAAITAATFSRIETIPLDVVYVSSEEGPGGEVAKNLVDNDPSTIWHTMYSITVPKYPHWVDFDCNETKMLKGFTYLPRQDGSPNGNIKAYRVQVSQDGQSWSEPVCEGVFASDAKEKRVLFPQPLKARYLRFTALSSQNGADFASGAEFGVLVED